MFHALAFFLFLPAIIFAKYDSPRFIALAMNCVIVAMIILETARYKRMLPGGRGKHNLRNTLQAELDGFLKSFCGDHEAQVDTLVASHIYLMIGSAYPFLQSFMLLDGSIFPANWALWSCTGVVFLGIGDTFAALGGFHFGRTRWRDESSKTQEGSSYMVITMTAAYCSLCYFVDERQMYLFIFYLIANIPSALIEGYTLQCDNVIGSMAHYALIVFFLTCYDD